MFKFFAPSAIEVLIVVGLSILSMIAFGVYATFSAVSGSPGFDQSFFANVSDQWQVIRNAMAASNTLAHAVTALFWAGIGGLVYVVFWLFGAGIADFKKQISFDEAYTHPSSYHKSDYWLSLVLRRTYYVALTLTLVAYGVLWLQIVLPIFAEHIYAHFNASWDSFAQLLLTIAAIFVSVHIFVVLLRFFVLRPRLFDKSL